MDIIPLLLKEFNEEAVKTRKFLEKVPEDKWKWKPHEKSMTLKRLTIHLAEIPSWVTNVMTTDGADFAKTPYKPTEINSKEELLRLHEESVEKGRSTLQNAKEEDFNGTWTLRNGEQIYFTATKYEMVRTSFAQTTHHRAQLGVYLRLLNIPIPGTYGPSADEPF